MISAQWFGIVTHCCVKFSENTEEDLWIEGGASELCQVFFEDFFSMYVYYVSVCFFQRCFNIVLSTSFFQ